jgi:hypothetical protein
MCSELGLKLQCMVEWSLAKGLLSDPALPHCPSPRGWGLDERCLITKARLIPP